MRQRRARIQAFLAESRRGASRRRKILTGSLTAGLVVAVFLAGLAYWQREVAVAQRKIADQQRQRAETTLAAATETANGLCIRPFTANPRSRRDPSLSSKTFSIAHGRCRSSSSSPAK